MSRARGRTAVSGPAASSEGAPPRLPAGYSLVVLETVTSTNDEAKRLAAEGAEDGTLVWAREQTAGRGRRGNVWASPPGNLYASLVLRPEAPPAEAAQLGLVAALAIGGALGTLVQPMTELRYKWPNDVLLNELKVAGILMESATTSAGDLDWLVLGFGVNLETFPAETDFPATSLKALGCDQIDAGNVLQLVCRRFLTEVNRWLDRGFAPTRKAWLHYAYRLGEEIEVRLENETLTGRFADLDAGGALVLESGDGERRLVAYGDVFPSAG